MAKGLQALDNWQALLPLLAISFASSLHHSASIPATVVQKLHMYATAGTT